MNFFQDGKCGVCGDEFSHPLLSTPRLFEIGGAYEKLIGKYPITRTYKSGQIINVTHEVWNLLANKLGLWT